ncbi:nucleotide-diphosphate-sugar epimerase [Microbispora rosea subsp. rosea]|nr:nucleotide-diphosphate-sugar epimerase [Microbispora rosea subsp. rosea]
MDHGAGADMVMAMILVTGATGTIGSETVRLLAAMGERVRAMTRNPAAITPPPGVEVVRGDFGEPDSLARAADKTEALFLLSAPGPQLVEHDEAMLAAACAAGVGTVVKVSAIGAGRSTGAGVGDWHLPGERAVRASGLRWTILRPSSFASNAVRWAGHIRRGEPIPNTTGTGRQGVVDPRDVAEVAVRALTSSDHAGGVLTLTGPELLSVPDQAAILGGAVGRRVTTADVPLEVYKKRMLAAGVDPAFAEIAVNGSRLVAQGGNATISKDVEHVLGRAPRTFSDWAHDHRAAFA